MIIEELQKLINDSQQGEPPQLAELFATFRNKPFWIWDKEEHRTVSNQSKGACCLNHILGLPNQSPHMTMYSMVFECHYCNST
jgi:hypothetical protein